MKIRTPYYFKDFNCISSKCPDTCCAGWEIIIDDETLDKYKKTEGNFSKRLKSEIIYYEDNEPGFKLKNNNCPFLNKNLLCDIYSELGEDYLCYTCKTFPRIIEEYGNLKEICISLSCPEAARLILKDNKKLSFDETENNDLVTSYNSINPELYIHLLATRKIIFDILNKDTMNLNEKLSLILSLTAEIQEKIDNLEIAKTAEIRKKFKDLEFQKITTDNNKKFDLMKSYLKTCTDFELINDNWPEIVNHAINTLYTNNNIDRYIIHSEFNIYYKERAYEYENLISYFIFRYFLKSLHDADVLSKVKLAIVSYLIIKELNITRWVDNNFNFSLDDQINISSTYSKQFEHSDLNIEKFYDLFNTLNLFSVNNIITLLN